MSKPATSVSLLQRKFIDDLEKRIVNRLQEEAKTPHCREDLARNTGITDEILLEELSQLGITRSSLMALRLLPLVLVAWAQKRVDAQERMTVLQAAKRMGIREGSDSYVMLDYWIHHLPPPESIDAWKRLMHETTSKMSGTAKQKLANMFETQMVEIAKASGGRLGWGRVSQKEQEMIDGLMDALRAQITDTPNPTLTEGSDHV